MKIIKFIRGNDHERCKFFAAEAIESIDSTIRRRFDIPGNITYTLVDTTDETTISFSMLWELENESIVRIEVQNNNGVTANPPAAAS